MVVPIALVFFLAASSAAADDFVVFQRDLNIKTFPNLLPAADESTPALRAWAARGETESLSFHVHAKNAVSGLQVTAGDLRGPRGARLPAGALALSRVEYVPLRIRGAGTEVHPLRLRPLAAPLDLSAGTTQQFWITLKTPRDAAPGDYRGEVQVRAPNNKPQTLTLHLTVHPFALDPPAQPFGIFLSPRFLPTVEELADLKERGFDALLWFWGHYGLRVVNEQGKLRVDFADLDLFLERVLKAGLKGPIVLALGNDSVSHYERALAQAFGLQLAPQVKGAKGRQPKVVGDLKDEQLNRLFVEGLKQLLEHGRSRGWPELVLLPYDEPTEQFIEEYRHRSGLIRKHFPGVRIYGVTMNRLAWAEEIVDSSDLLVANGDFERIGRLARDKQRGFWTYGSVAGRNSFGSARFRYGLAHWRHRSQSVWFWGYNWYQGDPYEESDGERGDSEWVIVYPPRPGEGARPIPTIAFEGMREAIDDVRYADTLERLLRGSSSAEAKEIREAFDRARRDWLAVNEDQALGQMHSFRLQVAGWITKLTNAR